MKTVARILKLPIKSIAKLYRYTYIYNNTLDLQTFLIQKTTPHGYWIDLSYKFWILPSDKKKKWVSKGGKKRYAYPTKKEALNNYILRSKKRIHILIGITQNTADGVKVAEKLIKTI